MAALSDNRIAWMYTADNGVLYRVAAVAAYTVQAKQGGAAWNGTAPPKPAEMKMRRITVRDAVNSFSRVVPLYTIGAPLATAGSTITLNRLGDSFSYESDGNPIPEGHIRTNVTKQSA